MSYSIARASLSLNEGFVGGDHRGQAREATPYNLLEKKLGASACGCCWIGMTLEFNDNAMLVMSYGFVTEATACTCACSLRTQVRSQPILRSYKILDTLHIRGNPVRTRGPDTMLHAFWGARVL